MADVAGGAAGAAEHLAADDETGADAGADLDVEQRVDVVEPRAPVLAEGHHVDVVVDEDGSGEAAGEPAADVEVVPAGHDRRAYRAAAGEVDRTGDAESGGPDCVALVARGGEERVEVGEHLGEHELGAVGDRELDRTRGDAHAGEVGDRDRAVGGAEVGAEDHPGPRVEREPSRWSSSGGGSGLHDDELVAHQLFEALSQGRPAQAGDLDQLGAGRGAPRADVLEHLPGGGGCEPLPWLRTFFRSRRSLKPASFAMSSTEVCLDN